MCADKDTINFFKEQSLQFQLDSFRKRVKGFFENNPIFYEKQQIVHSVKSRIKDALHLEEKIERKEKEKSIEITRENLLKEITDLVGVRVLYLYSDHFSIIHREIMKQVDNREWILFEKPQAYTWDLETKEVFDKYKISTKKKGNYSAG